MSFTYKDKQTWLIKNIIDELYYVFFINIIIRNSRATGFFKIGTSTELDLRR